MPDLPGASTSHIFPRSPGFDPQSHLSQISRARPPVTSFPDLPGSPPVTSFPDLPGLTPSHIFPISPGLVHQSHLSQISRVCPPVTSFPDLPGSTPCHIFPRSPGLVLSFSLFESQVMSQYVSRRLLLFSFFHSFFTKAAGSFCFHLVRQYYPQKCLQNPEQRHFSLLDQILLRLLFYKATFLITLLNHRSQCLP